VIVRFYVFAFGIGWGALLPFVLPGAGRIPALPLMAIVFLARFAPSLAGLWAAAAESGERGPADLIRRVVPRVRDAGWIALAAAAPVAIAGGVTGAVVAGGTPTGPTDPRAIGAFLPLLAQALFAGGGLGEELGWRGFALPRLQRVLHPLAATAIVGVLSAAWRWPAFRLEHAGEPGASFAVLLAVTVAVSVPLTWIYNRTRGGLAACAVLHGSVIAAGEAARRAVPLLWTNGVADGPLVAAWATAALLLIAGTRGRLGARPTGGPTPLRPTSPPGNPGTASGGPSTTPRTRPR
jgi:membrane protease YdiL (CAAX protease family)